MKTYLAAIALTLSLGPAQAGDVSVQDAWARATSPQATTGAVYLGITSKGGDKLVGVSTPLAGKAEIHQTYRKEGGVMGMRQVADVPLSASGPTVLAPGGFHIMLLELKGRLVKGQSFPMTLSFASGGRAETTVHVEAADANGPTQDLGPGHDMDSMPGKGN